MSCREPTMGAIAVLIKEASGRRRPMVPGCWSERTALDTSCDPRRARPAVPQPMNPDELSAALGVHPRTARRLLQVMSAERWVEPDPDHPDRTRLSTRIVSIAGEVLQRSDLVLVGAKYPRLLRDRLDESSHMSVSADGWAVHVVEVAEHAAAQCRRPGRQPRADLCLSSRKGHGGMAARATRSGGRARAGTVHAEHPDDSRLARSRDGAYPRTRLRGRRRGALS